MKKKLSSLCIMGMCVSVFITFGIVSGAYPQQPAKTVELKYVTMRGPTEPNAMIWQIPMAKEIEKQTGGKVKLFRTGPILWVRLPNILILLKPVLPT
jgi:hypothetical protein